jgi:TnpA family transposase
MNLINARYGQEPGLKAYTHGSDQFGPFATQTIPATVNEVPYTLDGLRMTEAGQKAHKQYADMGRFTDHVFAVTALPGFQFIPRIRALPSQRLSLFETVACPKERKGLIGGTIKEPLLAANWSDILRRAPPWSRASCPQARCEGRPQPTPGSMSWRWPCAKSDGSSGRASLSAGCSMPTCSAAPRSG